MIRALLSIVVCLAFARENPNAEILKRYTSLQTLEPTLTYESEIPEWLNSLKEDNRFSDVNYSAVNSAEFEPLESLKRASIMTKAYFTSGHPLFKQEKLKTAALEITRLWLKLDLKSPYPRYNTISVQTELLPILIRFRDEFKEFEIKKLREIFSRTSLTQNGNKISGQDLLAASDILIIRGILFKAPRDVSLGATEIKNILKVLPGKNGIQTDLSLFQNGPLPHQTGIGTAFTETLAKYFYVFTDSPYEFSADDYKLFDRFVLDAQRVLTFGPWLEISSSGGQFVRSQFGIDNFLVGLGYMIQTNSPRTSEYQAFYNSIIDRRKTPLDKNLHFFNSDLMVHRKKEFYASIRTHSRTLNSDPPKNGEVFFTQNMADGALFFTKTGTDYSDAIPLWDYTRIPGITAVQAEFAANKSNAKASMGVSTLTGGATDGSLGVTSTFFKKAGVPYHLSAKKTWAFTEFGVIAFGSDIRCPDCTGEVTTTVESAVSEEAPEVINEKTIGLNDKVWVNLSDKPWEIKSELKTGDRSALNKFESTSPTEGTLTEITFPHGLQPRGATYLYAGLSSLSDKSELRQFGAINSPKAQILYRRDLSLIMGTFFEAGVVKLGKTKLKASSPMAFILKVNYRNAQLSASDLTRSNKTGVLELQTKSDSLKIRIEFPQGSLIGKSINQTVGSSIMSFE